MIPLVRGWIICAAALLAACASGPHPAPLTTDSGCYALFAADREGAIVRTTGLRALPSFVGLDVTPVGVRGRRLILPATWEAVGPNPNWATWRFEGRELILTFVGFSGTLEVGLRRTPDGYAGETITPLPRGIPPVQVTLAFTTCTGLTGEPAAS
jgi:hypothetical protein